MLGKKSKIFILIGMIALLVLTGVLNIFLNQTANQNANAGDVVTDFFVSAKADREESRAASILLYEATIASTTASNEAKTEAETSKDFLVDARDTETALEILIKAAGFDDCIVTLTTENCNVIVKAAELTSDQVSRILEIVTTETGKKAKNVFVHPVE